MTIDTFFSNKTGLIILALLSFYFYALLFAMITTTTACNNGGSDNSGAGNTGIVEQAMLPLKKFNTCLNARASAEENRTKGKYAALTPAFAFLRGQGSFNEQ